MLDCIFLQLCIFSVTKPYIPPTTFRRQIRETKISGNSTKQNSFYQNEIANREHFKIKETRKLNRIVLTPDAVSGLVTARSYCVEQMHIRDYRCCSVLMLLLLPLTTIGRWLPGDRHASSSITETVGRDSAVLITSTPSHIVCTTMLVYNMERWNITHSVAET